MGVRVVVELVVAVLALGRDQAVQQGLGLAPVFAGMVSIPFALTSAVTAWYGGKLVQRYGRALVVLGIVLDGIPESFVVGMDLLSGEGIGVAFIAAVFLSNLPEAAAASSGVNAT